MYSPQGDALAFDRHGWGENAAIDTVSVDSSGVATGRATRTIRGDDSAGDQPNWGPSSPATDTPEAPLPIVLPVVAAGVAGAASAVRRRRTRVARPSRLSG